MIRVRVARFDERILPAGPVRRTDACMLARGAAREDWRPILPSEVIHHHIAPSEETRFEPRARGAGPA